MIFDFLKPKKIYALSELESIVSILFPPIQHIEIPEPNGGKKEIFIDSSVDSNLEACIVNYQDGTAGKETLDSLRYILKELRKVRSILDQTTYIKNGSYYVVDTPINSDLENIQPKNDIL